MEDYELEEIEFWRKLEEESMSRGSMLRRSAAAAVGLTILSGPAAAWAARAGGAGALAAPGIPKKLIAAAKKEGQLNVIALPHSWANYGEIISTFTVSPAPPARCWRPSAGRRWRGSPA